MEIDCIGLFVNNMETMVKFYRDIIGLKTNWNGEPNADFEAGKCRLIMFSRNDFKNMDLGVKSVFQPTTMPWGQRTCYVSDPEGNLLEIGSFGT